MTRSVMIPAPIRRVWAGLSGLPRIVLVVLIIAAIAISGLLYSIQGDASTVFRTVPVTRGDLRVDITASGTVEPEEAIDVGAQVAGQIVSLGTDLAGNPIDFGSEVEEGMVLAQIDQALYQSDVSQAEAQVKRAKADLAQLTAKLVQAERDWKRAQKLGPSEALAQSEYDAYEAAYETAKANVTVGEAAIVQAEAGLTRAQRNLAYTVITSPVRGVIIDRRVNIGQTVVSSLNAPSLFLLAKDLRRMDVWVAVNEADIGKIYPGQPVSFSVDAFPGETFVGSVRKIRLNASMTQNVVTYVVEVSTDNSNGRLLPYLTANVRFEVSNRVDALLVPNAALRYTPPGESAPVAAGQAGVPGKGSGRPGTVWIEKDGKVRPVQVARLDTDGIYTAIDSPEITAGDLVIVGEGSPDEVPSASGSTNPFAPPSFRRGGRRG